MDAMQVNIMTSPTSTFTSSSTTSTPQPLQLAEENPLAEALPHLFRNIASDLIYFVLFQVLLLVLLLLVLQLVLLLLLLILVLLLLLLLLPLLPLASPVRLLPPRHHRPG